jgi:hypothetical protein
MRCFSVSRAAMLNVHWFTPGYPIAHTGTSTPLCGILSMEAMGTPLSIGASAVFLGPREW